jgi:hypothetical protein
MFTAEVPGDEWTKTSEEAGEEQVEIVEPALTSPGRLRGSHGELRRYAGCFGLAVRHEATATIEVLKYSSLPQCLARCCFRDAGPPCRAPKI